jgi:hypothetical protein
MNTRTVVILGIVVVAIVGASIWFLQMAPEPGPATAVATPAAAPATPDKPVSGPVKGTPVQSGVKPVAPAPTTTVKTAPPSTPRPLAEWETRIDQVLRLNTANETESAQLLINMMPSLPPEGQVEAAQHISNLILDKDYDRVKPLLRNPSMPEEVHDVLFTDLMNREDGVKLPMLLDVAKQPNHPYHEEALTDLQIFLDQDNEQNWGKWDKAVKDYLQKQKAEEAASEAPAPAGTPGAPVPLPGSSPTPR